MANPCTRYSEYPDDHARSSLCAPTLERWVQLWLAASCKLAILLHSGFAGPCEGKKTHRDIPKNPQNAPIRHLPAPTSTPWVSTPNFRGHDSAPDTPRPPPTNGNPNPGPWAGTTPFLPPHKGGIDPQSTVPAGTRGKSVNFRGRDFGKPSPRPIQARNSGKNHRPGSGAPPPESP